MLEVIQEFGQVIELKSFLILLTTSPERKSEASILDSSGLIPDAGSINGRVIWSRVIDF